MKTRCFLLLIILSLCFSTNAIAQRKKKGKSEEAKKEQVVYDSITKDGDDVEIVINGEGNDLEEATAKALRGAIEQTFGAFVSSNTAIINDDIVKDEIATVSSGNVKAFRVLSSSILPNGQTSVSLQAIVSIGKLVSYVQSHGGTVEFAGDTFMMNMKMEEFNKRNERLVFQHLLEELLLIRSSLYNCSIRLGDPYKTTLVDLGDYRKSLNIDGYSIPICLELSISDNLYNWLKKLKATLDAVSLNDEDRERLQANGIRTKYSEFLDKTTYYLREDHGKDIFDKSAQILNNWINNWVIDINSGEFVLYPAVMNKRKKELISGSSIVQGQYDGCLYVREKNNLYRGLYRCGVDISFSLPEKIVVPNYGIPFHVNPKEIWSYYMGGLKLDFDDNSNGLVFDDSSVGEPAPKTSTQKSPMTGSSRKSSKRVVQEGTWVLARAKSNLTPLKDWSLFLTFEVFFKEEEISHLKNFEFRWNYE